MQATKSAPWKLIKIYRFPLFFALLIHLLFVAMLAKLTPAWQPPDEDKTTKPRLSSLSVSLQPTPPEITKPAEKKPEAEPTAKPEAIAVTKTIIEAPLLSENKTIQVAMPNTTDLEDKPTARLHSNSAPELIPDNLHQQLIQQLQTNKDFSKTAKLGTFNRRKIPGNWTRQAISYTPGMFRAAQLPLKAIVLDQWKNPDGGMQNRIKLPNGDVVCGNLAAHNPLDIYSMPIWMYRSC